MPAAWNGPVRIHFEVTGTGPALLLLPGLSNDIRDMRAAIEPLALNNTVIAVDNRGAGLSDKPDEPYAIELMADDALAVLDAAGVDRVNVLGYSMGGRIALQMAIEHPDRVDHLVLLATGARTISTLQRRLLFTISPYLPVGPKPRQPVYAFKHQRLATQAYDGRTRLGDVRSPTLILHGRGDRIAPPVLAEELHRGIEQSRLQWYDGGHLTPLMRPAHIAGIVQEFLV